MPRLQITVSDEVHTSLNQFKYPRDKRNFIEHAIRLALENKDMCKIYGMRDCIQEVVTNTRTNTIATINITHNTGNITEPKLKDATQQIEFDHEFED